MAGHEGQKDQEIAQLLKFIAGLLFIGFLVFAPIVAIIAALLLIGRLEKKDTEPKLDQESFFQLYRRWKKDA